MAVQQKRRVPAGTVATTLAAGRPASKSTIADLRALAMARGFKVERAMTGGDRWRILDRQGRDTADAKSATRVFSVDEGVRYLQNLGGVARYPVWRKT